MGPALALAAGTIAFWLLVRPWGVGHPGVMDKATKVREVRLRDAAARHGLALARSRRRDPLALGIGLYKLVDAATGAVVMGDGPGGFAATLDEVEAFLGRPRK